MRFRDAWRKARRVQPFAARDALSGVARRPGAAYEGLVSHIP